MEYVLVKKKRKKKMKEMPVRWMKGTQLFVVCYVIQLNSCRIYFYISLKKVNLNSLNQSFMKKKHKLSITFV